MASGPAALLRAVPEWLRRHRPQRSAAEAAKPPGGGVAHPLCHVHRSGSAQRQAR